jgi:hypothetical protein
MASKLTARKVETAKPGKDREKDAKLIALANFPKRKKRCATSYKIGSRNLGHDGSQQIRQINSRQCIGLHHGA